MRQMMNDEPLFSCHFDPLLRIFQNPIHSKFIARLTSCIASEFIMEEPGGSKKMFGSKRKSVEETYTKMTQVEHVLARPDTYVGSLEKSTVNLWVNDEAQGKVVQRACSYVPGLYKIFDEILVNAADNKQRDPKMSRINVDINVRDGRISVWNNGAGIPVEIHKKHHLYVPELIFGHLLTGSNFDDKEEKTTGGRNGYGAKLANIFSKRFIIETADSKNGLRYKQEFRDNMSIKGDPTITDYDGTDFTCVSFFPDLRRFHMSSLDDDIVALFSKRAYDIAASLSSSKGAKMKVYLNGSRIDLASFEAYLALHVGLEPPVCFAKVNDRWEIGIGASSDGAMQHISFVNSICTSRGGAHVDYIANQLAARLANVVKKQSKGVEIKPAQIKNHLAIYVNVLIVNPTFDSQTKETLTSKPSAFGSTCELPEKMLRAVEKSSIVENILTWTRMKQNADLKKKSGSKRSKVIGITKLDDANFAGTNKSKDCTLILTEGDSAKALAVSGLGVIGRDFYGVFPLKGKLLNVREASHAQIIKNEEIQNITKILGLTYGKTYDDTSSLRYGHLMIMTDQDHDGSHIKGLLINFLHHFWPSLLQIHGFLRQFITPIVKCTKGKQVLSFYTIRQYRAWREEHAEENKHWRIKYYKGLGTSTAAEAKEYFSDLRTHQIDFQWDAKAGELIDMAFAKKRVEDRKVWLLKPSSEIKENAGSSSSSAKPRRVTYDDFVNQELILYSHADNERSIAHVMDGLKPSQRKVLFACFKRKNLTTQEIKVAQLSGYIAEHSAYHHGEVSLTQTIINMAQNFVGSNNINLLAPCGQFGTRLMGGKDAASPRYVFTRLEVITRLLFPPEDDALLDYQEEDGQEIEPVYYAPIIPMALVNGSEGIGTGWSSSIPTYNPRDLIAQLRSMIQREEGHEEDVPVVLMPWFRGFNGMIQAKNATSYAVTGNVEIIDDQTIIISELPIGKWTVDYKLFLESHMIGNGDEKTQFVKDFRENHTDTTVLFTVTIPSDKLTEMSQDAASMIKKLKLDTSISTNNMNLFDLDGRIHKFDDVQEIITMFFTRRLELYHKRKAHLLAKMKQELDKLSTKVLFLTKVIDGSIIVANRMKAALLQELQDHGLKPFVESSATTPSDENENEVEESNEKTLEKGYDYLLNMKIWTLTREKLLDLIAQRDAKRQELDDLLAKSPQQLWLHDLDQLEAALNVFDATFTSTDAGSAKKTTATGRPSAASSSAQRRVITADLSTTVTTKKSSSSASKAITTTTAAVTKPTPTKSASTTNNNSSAKKKPSKKKLSSTEESDDEMSMLGSDEDEESDASSLSDIENDDDAMSIVEDDEALPQRRVSIAPPTDTSAAVGKRRLSISSSESSEGEGNGHDVGDDDGHDSDGMSIDGEQQDTSRNKPSSFHLKRKKSPAAAMASNVKQVINVDDDDDQEMFVDLVNEDDAKSAEKEKKQLPARSATKAIKSYTVDLVDSDDDYAAKDFESDQESAFTVDSSKPKAKKAKKEAPSTASKSLKPKTTATSPKSSVKKAAASSADKDKSSGKKRKSTPNTDSATKPKKPRASTSSTKAPKSNASSATKKLKKKKNKDSDDDDDDSDEAWSSAAESEAEQPAKKSSGANARQRRESNSSSKPNYSKFYSDSDFDA